MYILLAEALVMSPALVLPRRQVRLGRPSVQFVQCASKSKYSSRRVVQVRYRARKSPDAGPADGVVFVFQNVVCEHAQGRFMRRHAKQGVGIPAGYHGC